jgi:hypothetical protein
MSTSQFAEVRLPAFLQQDVLVAVGLRRLQSVGLTGQVNPAATRSWRDCGFRKRVSCLYECFRCAYSPDLRRRG